MVGAALDVCVLPGQNRGFGGLAGFDGGEAVVSGIGPGEVLTAGVPMGPLAVIWLSEGRWVPVEPFGGGLVVCGQMAPAGALAVAWLSVGGWVLTRALAVV